MERALELALGGWGRVAPNPLVGAVLLKDGAVVGEGYHREFGAPHAEVEALSSCDDASGATCVVNLEPCAHVGKTPACTRALVSAGVTRVVFAVSDPNTAAAGGAADLRKAGVDIESGLLRERAAALNAAFLWAETRPERPFVAVKLATSLDGFVADKWGKSQWITGPEARQHVHWLRAGFDAVAVGRRTAQHDDPQLTARGDTQPRVPPTRIVVARSGSLEPTLKLVRTADAVPTILLTDTQSRSSAERSLAGTAVSIVTGRNLADKLNALRTAGIRSLLVEGGADLVGALLDEDLVDRIYLFQEPILLGEGKRGFSSGRAQPLDDARHWTPVERRIFGQSNLLVVDRGLCLPE